MRLSKKSADFFDSLIIYVDFRVSLWYTAFSSRKGVRHMDVIAAIATGASASAIGIVRISGAGAYAVCDRVFRARNGKAFADQPPHRMTIGRMIDAQGRMIDEGLAVRFPAAHSYTGEESAELHCHGSPVVLNELLRACFAAGARQAQPGEYTRRAFLNGRMDLTAAEAVIDLIDAETAEAARNAALQLGGAIADCVSSAYDALLEITSRFYAVVDYPDEDVEDLTRERTDTLLAGAERTLGVLLATYARGRVMKSGVATAIIGAPNAGKSSLLNALVGYERAIVTDIAGTTRDTVEEKAILGGVLLRLIDTAGIRETDDAVEKLGVERSRRALEASDLALALVDGSKEPGEDDCVILRMASARSRWILVRTKADLAPYPAALPENLHRAPDAVVSLSARTGAGFDALESAVAALFPQGEAPSGTLLTNARQADAVERALASVRAAREALHIGFMPDAVLTEAETAMNALGELTGRTARDDMVSRIFERFCVGK